jgi:hypothetical protein
MRSGALSMNSYRAFVVDDGDAVHALRHGLDPPANEYLLVVAEHDDGEGLGWEHCLKGRGSRVDVAVLTYRLA